MRIGCYEPVYNFCQILDLLKPNLEKSYGRMGKKWGNSPNIPGRISREWFEVSTTKLGLLEHTVNSNSFFRCFRRGWWNVATHNFRKFVLEQTACSCGVPLTINLNFLTGNVEEKEHKWRSQNFNFQIRADPLPPPPAKLIHFLINGWDHTFWNSSKNEKTLNVGNLLTCNPPYPLPVEKILDILVVTLLARLVKSIVLWRIPTPRPPITPSVEEFFD